MGCLEEKAKSDDEVLLQFAEQQLNSGVRASNLTLLISTFPAVLSREEFKSAKSILHLHEEHLSESELSRFDAFFQMASEEPEKFDKRKLEVLGLLLCKESKSKKITTLFKCGELDEGQKLLSDSLLSLLEFAFTLSLEVLPATLTAKASSRFPKAAPTRYLRRLQAQKDIACQRCWKILTDHRPVLRLDTFLQTFQLVDLELSPEGVRAYTLGQCSAYWSDRHSTHSQESEDIHPATKGRLVPT